MGNPLQTGIQEEPKETVSLVEYLTDEDWHIIDELRIDSRAGDYFDYDDLGLSSKTCQFLRSTVPKGIYSHQKEALKGYFNGENVCLSTGTGSGKSLVFYAAGIEELVKNPQATILAIYPLKALGKEQEERWKQALQKANLQVKVGRIDGQVPIGQRNSILRNSRILITTPDIIHAWLLRNISENSVMKMISRISLIIIDEIHNYTGVFGSNSAFLFRRLQHAMSLLGASSRYITASATIANPELHLEKLLGCNFRIIDSSLETSPKQEVVIKLINPPITKDLLTALSELMNFISRNTNHKFLCFVDSRKQTEYLTSITSRIQIEEEKDESIPVDHLIRLNILPYRAGYEESDRTEIQKRLSAGTLQGVVSTSALELGIDIPFLTLGILVGVPRSITSLQQRIGRIGRHTKGEVLIINSGDVYSQNIFRKPKHLLKLPLSEGALYLENTRIQYIHALCLARQGGEHDQLISKLQMDESTDFISSIVWPKGFLELCRSERIGIIPPELQNMKAQAGDEPNHVFPLRDVDVQFRVERIQGPVRESLGSLSYGQLMREAYPGAIYYYTTRPYRVYRVKNRTRTVQVRAEKHYTTKPLQIPTLVFPNMSAGNVYGGISFENLTIIECNLQIREALKGFKERRGRNELTIDYPLNRALGLYFDQERFTRNYFTTGVILNHPLMNAPRVKPDIMANVLFEAYLMTLPFERRDINFASDRHRAGNRVIKEGDKFVSIYDQTYGSLRLSGRILEGNVMREVLEKAVELAYQNDNFQVNQETLEALTQLLIALDNQPVPVDITVDTGTIAETDNLIKVMLPGSKGINLNKGNEEFIVEGVFFSPVHGGLAYRGKHASQQSPQFEDLVVTVPISSIVAIPGESKYGLYNLELGELQKME